MTNRPSRGRPAPPGPPGRRPPPRPRFSSLSKSLLLWALILFVPLYGVLLRAILQGLGRRSASAC